MLLSLFYTLIKLDHTKALRDQASSLARDCIPLLRRPRILTSFLAHSGNFSRLCTYTQKYLSLTQTQKSIAGTDHLQGLLPWLLAHVQKICISNKYAPGT